MENYNNQHLRNSEDEIINTKGKELVDLCKLNDFLIVNGRSISDLFAKFTSHQRNGFSVSDYLLSPDTFSHNISMFSAGDLIPWISDHYPIYSIILLNDIKFDNKILDSKLTKVTPGYIFDENSRNIFTAELTSQATKEKRKKIDSNESTVINIAAEIKTIVLSNAQSCNLRSKKNPRSNKDLSAPWFDEECASIKNDLRKLGRILKLIYYYKKGCSKNSLDEKKPIQARNFEWNDY